MLFTREVKDDTYTVGIEKSQGRHKSENISISEDCYKYTRSVLTFIKMFCSVLQKGEREQDKKRYHRIIKILETKVVRNIILNTNRGKEKRISDKHEA